MGPEFITSSARKVSGGPVPLSLLLLFSVPVARAEQPSPAPTAGHERLSALVPDPPPARAVARESPSFYSPSTLYEYIDGAADVFQSYDVQEVLHQDFTAGAADVTVDIFDMGRLENAFGMYAAERSPGYDFVAMGAEGYRNEGILNFFQDRYYVKLAGFGAGADAALHQFGAAISGRIGADRSFPDLLSKLPDRGRKARTERYLRQDPLGHSFLSPVYQAQYGLDHGDAVLMISVGASAADAASRARALEDHFRRTGAWSPAPEFGSEAGRGSNSFEGSLVAAPSAQYLLILLNPPGDSATFFRDAAARLR